MGIEELSHSDKMPMPITAKALPHRRLGMRLLVKRGSDGHPGSRPGAKTVADVAAAPGRNQVPRGIAYMLGSTVMFAGVLDGGLFEESSTPAGFVIESTRRRISLCSVQTSGRRSGAFNMAPIERFR